MDPLLPVDGGPETTPVSPMRPRRSPKRRPRTEPSRRRDEPEDKSRTTPAVVHRNPHHHHWLSKSPLQNNHRHLREDDPALAASMMDEKIRGTTPTPYVAGTNRMIRDLVSQVEMELKRRGCEEPSVVRAQVFEEAMDTFLGKYPVFGPFLELYRTENVKFRAVYAGKVAKLPELMKSLDTVRVKGEEDRQSVRLAARETENKLEAMNRELRRQLVLNEEKVKALTDEISKKNEDHRKMCEECEELRRSSIVLTQGMRRLEEEQQKWQRDDNAHRCELLNVTTALQKEKAEKDAIQRQFHEHEVTAAKELHDQTSDLDKEVATLKKDLDTLRSSNRALQRQYRALKEDNDKMKAQGCAPGARKSNFSSRGSRSSFRSSRGSISDAPPGSRLNPENQQNQQPPAPVAEATADEDDDDGEPEERKNFFGPYDWWGQEEAWTGDFNDIKMDGDPTLADYAQKYQEKLRQLLLPGNVPHEMFPLLPCVNPETEDWEPVGTYFEGRGTGDDVPPYLRYDGRIRNWLMSKRDTENMIDDIWAAREEAAEKEKEPLGTFLYSYLVGRFKSHVLAVENAYNLLDAIERYKADSDCKLFIEILEDRLPEEIRADQLAMLVEVHHTMVREDRQRNGTTGVLSSHQFMTALRNLLKAKPEANFQKLQRALLAECHVDKDRSVDYKKLLQSDDDGNQGPFCELLRQQHVEEIMEFHTELADAIRDSAVAYKATTNLDMPIAKFRDIIMNLDPEKPRSEVSTILATGLACDVKKLAELELQHLSTNYESFLANILTTIVLKRSSPPPAPQSPTVGPGGAPIGGGGGDQPSSPTYYVSNLGPAA